MSSFRVSKHDISNLLESWVGLRPSLELNKKNWLFFKIELELKLGVAPIKVTLGSLGR
jgi:hypothetical protein